MTKPGEIHSLLLKVMADVGPITKGRENTHFKYSFRGIDDLYNAIQPALIKHGVTVTPSVLDVSHWELEGKSGPMFRIVAKVAFTFTAVSDGSVSVAVTLGEGLDSGDKACNKAMSAAIKYAFIQSLCIPTEGLSEDSDSESPQAVSLQRNKQHSEPAPASARARSVAPVPAAGDALTELRAWLASAKEQADLEKIAAQAQARLSPADQAKFRREYGERKAQIGASR